MLCDNNLSAADVAAVTRSNDNNGGGWGGACGFGMEALIAIVILFLFPMMFGGWGGGFGGFGGFGGGAGAAMASGALTRADLCSEFNFNGLENAVRGIQQGICDSTFALNNTITSGFSGVNNAVCNLGYTFQQQFNQSNMNYLQGQNALQAQIAQCCCDNRVGQMQMENAMNQNFCTTNYNAATNTTAIIQNAHNDTDRVLARLDAMESARKDDTIADLRSKLAACNDQTTAQYIINRLSNVINPPAVPAYPAASPCGLGNWSANVLANSQCGCGGCGGCGTCGA